MSHHLLLNIAHVHRADWQPAGILMILLQNYCT